jgi:hypothetical protein
LLERFGNADHARKITGSVRTKYAGAGDLSWVSQFEKAWEVSGAAAGTMEFTASFHGCQKLRFAFTEGFPN